MKFYYLTRIYIANKILSDGTLTNSLRIGDNVELAGLAKVIGDISMGHNVKTRIGTVVIRIVDNDRVIKDQVFREIRE